MTLSKAEIKKVILDIAGNPESGVVFELADDWAQAISDLISPPGGSEKETRVIKPSELR
jgi:hypothetical protein